MTRSPTTAPVVGELIRPAVGLQPWRRVVILGGPVRVGPTEVDPQPSTPELARDTEQLERQHRFGGS